MTVGFPFSPIVRAGALSVPLALAAAPAFAAGDVYFRLGGGLDWTDDTTFSDKNCAQTQPPALFGCATGPDGRGIGARGDFGNAVSIDAGIGYRISPAWRIEGLISYHPDFDFSGEADFLNVGSTQPVSTDVSSLTTMVVGYADLVGLGVPRVGALEPFVGAGVGLSRHSVDRVAYEFPSLGDNAATVTRGGASWDLSFMLTAGASLPLTNALTLDVSYRYLDLGRVETKAGAASIIRASGTRQIDIAGTEVDLTSHGVAASLRYAF